MEYSSRQKFMNSPFICFKPPILPSDIWVSIFTKLRLECKNADSSPVNSPSEPINLEKGDDNNSPNVTVEKQS